MNNNHPHTETNPLRHCAILSMIVRINQSDTVTGISQMRMVYVHPALLTSENKLYNITTPPEYNKLHHDHRVTFIRFNPKMFVLRLVIATDSSLWRLRALLVVL